MLAVHLGVETVTRCALLDVRSSSPSWQSMATAVSARRTYALVAVDEYSVVMLGGYEPIYWETHTAQLYDARADWWSERAEWRLTSPSTYHCAALIE